MLGGTDLRFLSV